MRRLAVVTCLHNPRGSRARVENYRRFAAHIEASGAELWTCECAFGERPFEVTRADDPHHVQVRSGSEIWLKENLMNLATARVPREYDAIAMIDADAQFARHDWVSATLDALDRWPVAQMWSSMSFLDATGEIIEVRSSWMERWHRGVNISFNGVAHINQVFHHPRRGLLEPFWLSGEIGSPGLAWAYRRETLDELGGLFDAAICGAGDHFMAAALIGSYADSIPERYSRGFRTAVSLWAERAEVAVKGAVGLVRGNVLHYWHGPRADRRYSERETILQDHAYDPFTDIVHDSQGVLALRSHAPRLVRLRADLRSYFAGRNEE